MKAQEQSSEALETLKDKIKAIEAVMLFTEEEDGNFRSRPMQTIEMDEDGTIWFFTGKNSAKVRHINRNPRVNLGYSHPGKDTYVTVSGEAQLVLDKAKIKDLWNPIHKAWFPDGVDDPNIALLKITVNKAEYWDASSSKMVQLIGFVKAIATGKPYAGEGSEHEKLNF